MWLRKFVNYDIFVIKVTDHVNNYVFSQLYDNYIKELYNFDYINKFILLNWKGNKKK